MEPIKQFTCFDVFKLVSVDSKIDHALIENLYKKDFTNKEMYDVLISIKIAKDPKADHSKLFDVELYEKLKARVSIIRNEEKNPIQCLATTALKRQSTNAVSVEQSIQDFVKNFLFPYVSNQMSEEDFISNEEKRVPMMDLLVENLKENHGIQSATNIEQLALREYIKCAAEGLYTNSHVTIERPSMKHPIFNFPIYLKDVSDVKRMGFEKNPAYRKILKKYNSWLESKEIMVESLPSFTHEILILLDALIPAIEKDFPDLKMSAKNLVNLIILELENVNTQRKVRFDERIENKQQNDAKRNSMTLSMKPRSDLYIEMQKQAFCDFIASKSKLINAIYFHDLSETEQGSLVFDISYNENLKKMKHLFIGKDVPNIHFTKEFLEVFFSAREIVLSFRVIKLDSSEMIKLMIETLNKPNDSEI